MLVRLQLLNDKSCTKWAVKHQVDKLLHHYSLSKHESQHRYTNPHTHARTALKRRFRQIDLSNSGLVDTNELQSAFSSLGIPMNSEQVQHI